MPYEWIVASLAVQMSLMTFDEFHFHRRRGLPKWERIGHPVDTVFTLAPLVLAALSAPSQANRTLYIALAILSCVIITKDEPVHARHCSPTEHWLHAALFIVHPVVLLLIGYAWMNAPADSLRLLQELLLAIIALVSGFLLYQIIYWNFLWHDRTNSPP